MDFKHEKQLINGKAIRYLIEMAKPGPMPKFKRLGLIGRFLYRTKPTIPLRRLESGLPTREKGEEFISEKKLNTALRHAEESAMAGAYLASLWAKTRAQVLYKGETLSGKQAADLIENVAKRARNP